MAKIKATRLDVQKSSDEYRTYDEVTPYFFQTDKGKNVPMIGFPANQKKGLKAKNIALSAVLHVLANLDEVKDAVALHMASAGQEEERRTVKVKEVRAERTEKIGDLSRLIRAELKKALAEMQEEEAE